MIAASLLLAVASLALEAPDTIRTEELDEVVVSGKSAGQRLQQVLIGTERLSVEELQTAPSLLGERDVLRSVQLLPGVKQESEVSSGFQVRGGTSVQNAILYDHVPVYNVGHLAGLFSAFNGDALSGVTLYKGCQPVQYGGGSSAVLDVSTRSGATDRWHGGAAIGLLSAKASAEGPLGSRAGLLVSARRSYADVPLQLVDKFRGNTLYFYDVNTRFDWLLGDADRLRLSLFGSRDRTALEDMASMEWTNLAASLNWRHHYHSGSHAETTLLLSDYHTHNAIDLLGMSQSISGRILQWGLRQDFRLLLWNNSLDVGMQSKVVGVKTAEWQVMDDRQREVRRAWENALWAGLQLKLSPGITVQGGLRLETFSSLGGTYYYDIDRATGNIVWYYRTRRYHIVNTHVTLDPRLSLVWQLSPQFSLKAGYGRNTQNIHALRGQTTSTPFDRYTLSSNIISPERSDQFSLGLFGMTTREDYDFSLEGYYRSIDDILDYRDGKSFGSAIEMERLVLPGQGRCYGGELMVRKNSGRLTGWVSYTLSWAENQIDGVNGGRWYTAGNDRRHDVDIVALWRLSPAWTFGALWVYNSGQAFTAPSGKYEMIDNYIYYYAERNGYRAPAYHRLDLSTTWTKTLCGGRITREWQFGIYNLYNRYNPFIINFEDSDQGARTKAVGYSLFGIVPSVSVSVKF